MFSTINENPYVEKFSPCCVQIIGVLKLITSIFLIVYLSNYAQFEHKSLAVLLSVSCVLEIILLMPLFVGAFTKQSGYFKPWIYLNRLVIVSLVVAFTYLMFLLKSKPDKYLLIFLVFAMLVLPSWIAAYIGIIKQYNKLQSDIEYWRQQYGLDNQMDSFVLENDNEIPQSQILTAPIDMAEQNNNRNQLFSSQLSHDVPPSYTDSSVARQNFNRLPSYHTALKQN